MKALSQQQLESLENLFEAISLIRTGEEAHKFFEDLCTPKELEAMAGRWQVVSEVKQEKSYRKIYEDTGVSVTTVGRIARFLTSGTGGYSLIYERFKGSQNAKKSKT